MKLSPEEKIVLEMLRHVITELKTKRGVSEDEFNSVVTFFISTIIDNGKLRPELAPVFYDLVMGIYKEAPSDNGRDWQQN